MPRYTSEAAEAVPGGRASPPGAKEPAKAPLDVAVLPDGALVADALADAFSEGAGEGLLALLRLDPAAAPLAPGAAWWRALALRLLDAVRVVPDIEERRGFAEPPPPPEGFSVLALSAPPMRGGEYVDAPLLARVWSSVARAARASLEGFEGTADAWLATLSPEAHVVGRVCFHLAENRRDEKRPFAFLATYAVGLSKDRRARHAPLGRALTEHAAADRKDALLRLLLPVQRAAQRSPLVRALVDSGEVYHPLAWTPAEAHRFLTAIPDLEASGVVVRVPDWWSARSRPRATASVTIGAAPAAGTLGAMSMLDFKVELALDGVPLTPAEAKALLAASDGLALVRGRWVEVDRARIEGVLGRWRDVERAVKSGGITFAEGLRLVAGARLEGDAAPDEAGLASGDAGWSRVVAGAWLERLLEALRAPSEAGFTPAPPPGPSAGFHATLRPYQAAGLAWLARLSEAGLGACLADDMGLGKTLQTLALFVQRGRASSGRSRLPHLLVAPASLLANWRAEAARFAPELRLFTAHPSEASAQELASAPEARLAATDVVITSYGALLRTPWLAARDWDLVVIDEAQAVKNPGAKQTRAVKALRARARVALTGTPVENRLGDLWSLFDFLVPGLLGSAKSFSKYAKSLEAAGAAGVADAYAPLRRLIRPFLLRRRKTDPGVVPDLPAKTELRTYCPLSRVQAALYREAVDALAAELERQKEARERGDKSAATARRGVVLASLMRLKQICNHPSHWLQDGRWDEASSGKMGRLRELVEPIAARQERALVFTQFRETTAPLARFLGLLFGREGLVLDGTTPVAARRALVDRFQDPQGPPFFVLSLKAGGTGLNLTAASHVVHFDRWWNPAVEDQATDRAFRIGQRKNVLVHKLVCRGTVEERIDALIEAKKGLAAGVVEGDAGGAVTELTDEALLSLVALDERAAVDVS